MRALLCTIVILLTSVVLENPFFAVINPAMGRRSPGFEYVPVNNLYQYNDKRLPGYYPGPVRGDNLFLDDVVTKFFDRLIFFWRIDDSSFAALTRKFLTSGQNDGTIYERFGVFGKLLFPIDDWRAKSHFKQRDRRLAVVNEQEASLIRADPDNDLTCVGEGCFRRRLNFGYDEHISALQNRESFGAVAGRSCGGSGDNPKRQSENSKQESSEANKRLIMILCEIPGARTMDPNLRIDRSYENAAVFLKLVFGILCVF
jgi:hypothetical protein